MANTQKRDEWYVSNEYNDYILEYVPTDISIDGVHALYRILNKTADKVHYKGICMSRTYIAIERNKGKTTEELFDEAGKNFIENALLMGDEENKEIVMHSDRIFWKPLDLDGGHVNG